MIDVSYQSVQQGMVKILVEELRTLLDELPKDVGLDESLIKVGFVTYSTHLHFYNVKENLAQPQMMIMSDVKDAFVPLLDGFLVNYKEAKGVVERLALMFTVVTTMPKSFVWCSLEFCVILGVVFLLVTKKSRTTCQSQEALLLIRNKMHILNCFNKCLEQVFFCFWMAVGWPLYSKLTLFKHFFKSVKEKKQMALKNLPKDFLTDALANVPISTSKKRRKTFFYS